MMDGIFSLQTLREMQRQIGEVSAPPSENPLFASRSQQIFGINLQQSNAFPFVVECGKCGGSGEGDESTYCKSCDGAGRNRFEGMMRNGPRAILIKSSLPKAFAPRFPSGLVPAPPMSRGLA